MVPEPPGVPVIEEITIIDSSDDDDEASPSNNDAINKENTPENRTEKAIDPFSDILVRRQLNNEFYSCDPLADDCNSPPPDHENPREDPLGNISIAESYSLDDRFNGDFIILDQQRDLGVDESDDEISVIYMETSDDASDHNTATDDDSDKQLYIADDTDHNTAPGNKNDDDSDKELYIADDTDHNTTQKSKSDDDSDKQLYIADDTDPPDDKTLGSDINVTDKSVSREKEKSRLNENATAEKKETMDCSSNDEKTADDVEMDLEKDSGIQVVITSGGAENNFVIAPQANNRMRVCLKRLLVPFCHNCEMPRSNTRGWVRRQRSECLICGGELAYSCQACEYENSSLRKAMWHVKRCCSEKLWRCYKCPYASVVEERVKAHIEYNHSNKENEDGVDYVTDKWGYYRCGICRKGFRSLPFLRLHENYCGVERTVRIVNSENKKQKRARRKKKKEPAPSVVEEVKKNADEFIKLHCYKCNLTFEKGKKEKKCDKCETPLLWQCVKCSTKSKSYCGLYDHVNNCTNEITQLILV